MSSSFELQELWFRLSRTKWRSLAFVPAHKGGSALPLCRALAELGGAFQGAPLAVTEAEDLSLEAAAALMQVVRSGSATRRLVAVGPLVGNPLGIPVCLACDGVLLVVVCGVTTHPTARRTLELVGRERVIGSVMYERAS